MTKKIHLTNSPFLVLLGLLLLLSVISYFIPYFNLDISISKMIQNIDSSIFDQIMRAVSTLGNQPLMVFVVITGALILFLSGLRREAVISSLFTAIAVLSGALVKMIVDRPRPSDSLVRVTSWLTDNSYPSNHTLAFTVFFGFLLYVLLKKVHRTPLSIFLTIILILLIATIGISRIYLGVHWASDVAGGYLFGLLWLSGAIKIYNTSHGQR
ncbi:MAG TPA: phosphatase PAP2 family protein [Candidatus Woesebacteria bacterium]|nr:phosphatase PAP2 family protein [Candidatus Woesebacteria bacterium]